MTTLRDLIRAAVTDENCDVEINPMGNIKEAVRQNDKRAANLTWETSDEWVKNLVGNSRLRDCYLMIRIPRELFDKMTGKTYDDDDGDKKESPLILP